MLKDNWIDKVNNVDYIYAEDINSIAHAVIDAEDEIEKLKENVEEPPEGFVEEKNIANSAVTRPKIASGAIAAYHFGEEVMPINVPEGDELETSDLDFYTFNGVYFFNGFEKTNTPEGLSYSPFYLFVSFEEPFGNQVILCGGEQPSLWGREYDTGEWSAWQKLESGAALTEGAVHTEHLADGAVTLDKVSFTADAVGKNLIDTTKLTKGRLTAQGTVGGKPDQSVTDFIEIDPLSSYVYSCIGTTGVSYVSYRFEYYDEQKQHISGAGSNGVNTNTANRKVVEGITHDYDVLTPPPEARFIRISASTVGFPIAQFEKGVESTAYEAYMTVKRFDGVDVLNSTDVENTLDSEDEKKVLSAKQGSIISSKLPLKKLAVSFAEVDGEESVLVHGRIGKKQSVKMTIGLGSGGNGQVNFDNTELIRGTSTQMRNVHGTDDVAPLRTNYGTLGGNHAYDFIGVVDSTGALANRIGQTCNNGTTDFLLVDYKAASNVGVFARPYISGDVNEVSAATIAEGDVLTFADGSITAGADSSVSYRSINKRVCSFVVDGKETTEQRNYECDTFAIRETYNIVSLKGIWDYYADEANHGKAYNTALADFGGFLVVEITYTIGANCSMVVNTTYRALENMRLNDCGTIQSGLSIAGTNDTVYMYLHKAGATGGYDFSTPIALPSGELSQTVRLTPNNSGVCNRNVVLVKKSDGTLSYGFTSGFIPDISCSKDAERAKNGKLWEIRYNSKKSYPVAVYNKTLLAGESMTFLAYRAFLPEETPVTNFNIVDVGETAYLFIDAHTSGTFTVDVDSKYCNRVIDVLEQNNIEISSDVVGNSITFGVTDDYGYATLKLK